MDINFYELTQAIKNQLEELQYSVSTIRRYQSEWSKFEKHMKLHNISDLSSQSISEYFLENYNVSIDDAHNHTRSMRMTSRSLNVLIEYMKSGVIYRRQAAKNHQWPSCYESILNQYMTQVIERVSSSSVRQYRSIMENFISFLISKNHFDFSEITPDIITEYWHSREHLCKKTLTYDSYVLRNFFNFLFENDHVVVDYSVIVPKPKINSNGNIPSFYTTNELTALLAAVDRANPIGRRDYAILILAIRYGMRVGDIRNLTLSSFDWTNSKISFIQSKTGKHTEFDLLPDVANALIDYFKNGRPKTDCPYVFVRHNAPYTEFGKDNNLHYIISKYMRIANIPNLDCRKHGLHSLRHSIAGNMLSQGVPMPTVSEVLGHSSTQTTMIYTKINIEQLAHCALEVD